MTKKVLILALDSVNLESIQPHLEAGRMPNLKHLISGGTSGVLMSTVPAHTAAAWTTLSTGKHPGLHGVMNFRRFDPRTQQTRLNTTHDVPHKTIWQLLDSAGLRVGVVGQPQSYPPRPLTQGFAVTGFETPSTDVGFTWPQSLKDEVLARVPEFCFKSERVRDPGAGKDWDEWSDFSAGMDNLQNEMEQAHALNLFLAREKLWDVLFLYYQSTDPLFHKAWLWCDPETRNEDPLRAGRIDQFFARLDQMLGEIIALPQSQNALIVACSDHGHGPVHELVRVNGLLAELGFLKRGGLLTQARDAWRNALGQRKGKGLGIAVDWNSTRAYMPFEAIAGFIYLNKNERESQGCVDAQQIPELLASLIEKLSSQKSPLSGRPLFDAIKNYDDVYPVHGEFDAPDLFAFPARGINLVRKLSFGPSVEIPKERYKGTHRPEGFFALFGAGVKAGQIASASIADIAPTILAALGQPVPSDMSGRVLNEFFQQSLNARADQPAALVSTERAGSTGGEAVYSEEERQQVEQRLADLGYLE